jgi:hypothetical protein
VNSKHAAHLIECQPSLLKWTAFASVTYLIAADESLKASGTAELPSGASQLRSHRMMPCLDHAKAASANVPLARSDFNGPLHTSVCSRDANGSVWSELRKWNPRARRTGTNVECHFSVLRGLYINARLMSPTEMAEDLSSSMTE